MVNAKNKRDSRKNQDKKEKKLPSVSLVIVNYNGIRFLKDCLDSVFKLDYPREKIEVIVVDNGSKDGSLKFISKNYPKVKLLKNDKNNYARANNLGIKKSHSELVAILNNDTKVDKKWLIELVKRISKDKRIGGVCSKVLLMDGRIDSAGIAEFPNFYWQNRGYNEEDKGQYDRAQEVYALCGVSMLFRKKCLEEAGFEDEDFNIYVEEIDLAERCKKLGWKLVYCPKSVLLHHHGGTINENSETFT
ncbi:MAG: glycosyltransferase family 2 protein, partial [Candidatus Woesearchaeota archaeon]|nr:glycosyltransferase family 2 protein [Candidatus Woesearchaeota archaeon]